MTVLDRMNAEIEAVMQESDRDRDGVGRRDIRPCLEAGIAERRAHQCRHVLVKAVQLRPEASAQPSVEMNTYIERIDVGRE